ncbi:hypothetical protein ASPZODRAFT_1535228 [Penicilliopsis zonata CBS 506.65]|uniref:Cytochrome c oxidase copper chaperone Cox17 n=1 Tax=Penicilliopsis zonata CBS 506.65 TaxID=1073090 RepID=A0A1L9SLQ0_9EURO|nr:hypothetical protein ASPZODRAFT_1535228 [Penicilliopsis zonata CBS 506.65]OJJ48169.1 hypothetical protein ASPZODRAFT_1535228 [Penicilliopsis zonata CBS 506.65]
MSWLFGSSKTAAVPTSELPEIAKPAEKPKPCCVCKDEKTSRDDCMLFAKSDDPQAECTPVIEQYKACMASYGFKV